MGPVPLLAILGAALWIRLPGLTEWWLNPDEGIYYSIVTRARLSGFWDEVASNAHPPLYYAVLRTLGLFSWDFLWFRSFSLVCGLAAVGALWAVARALAGPGPRGTIAAAVTALLLALSPGAIDLSQVIRPYTLQLALLSGALWCLLRYLRATPGHERRLLLVGYVVLAAVAMLTHYSSALAVAGFGLVVLYDGLANGTGRATWRTLFSVHAVPAFVLGLVYLVHLRPLMRSALAADALDGWLAPYMIGSPAEAWSAFLGFQRLVVPGWLRGPAALLMIGSFAGSAVALVWRARADRTREDETDAALPGVLLGSGMAVSIALAAMGVYPLGSTRHSAWLLVFTLPAVGWLVAWALTGRPRAVALRAAALVALLTVGGPLGRALGVEDTPWAPSDRVLRRSELTRMVDVLDPSGTPELVIMSAQTFYVLLPFYAQEREAAVTSADGSLFHFAYGERRILVSEAWDFTGGRDRGAPGDLAGTLTRAAAAFPELGLRDAAQAVFLAGGWRPRVLDALIDASAAADPPFLLGQRSVPGLWGFLMDVPAFLRAYGAPPEEPVRVDPGS